MKVVNGLKIYSVNFWPGWLQLLGYFFIFLIITVPVVFVIITFRNLINIMEDLFESSVLNYIFPSLLSIAMDITSLAIFALIAVWIPYFILYILSPKQFWIEGDTIVHKFRLLGILGPTRRIHFDNIRNIEVSKSGRRHHLKVRYDLTLPIWIRIFTEFWSDKTPQCVLTLANDVDNLQTAKAIAEELMEVVTAAETN